MASDMPPTNRVWLPLYHKGIEMPHEIASHCLKILEISREKISSWTTKPTLAAEVAAGFPRAEVYPVIPSIATIGQQLLSGVIGMPIFQSVCTHSKG